MFKFKSRHETQLEDMCSVNSDHLPGQGSSYAMPELFASTKPGQLQSYSPPNVVPEKSTNYKNGDQRSVIPNEKIYSPPSQSCRVWDVDLS